MMTITSTSQVQGKKITAVDGVVSSWCWFDPDGDEAAKQEAWDGALADLVKKARRQNANAIIHLRDSYTPCGDKGMLMFSMLGTAVSLGSE